MKKSIAFFLVFIVVVSCTKSAKPYGTDGVSLDRLMVAKAEFDSKESQRQPNPEPAYTDVSDDYKVDSIVNDSDALVVKKRSVVFAFYSESEIRKKFTLNKDSQVVGDLYDDIYYHTLEIADFLDIKKKEHVIIESEKKYIKFIMADKSSIIINRHKAVDKIFFFDPKGKIIQSDIWVFVIGEYKRF